MSVKAWLFKSAIDTQHKEKVFKKCLLSKAPKYISKANVSRLHLCMYSWTMKQYLFSCSVYSDMFYFAEVKTKKEVFVNGSHLLLYQAGFSQPL